MSHRVDEDEERWDSEEERLDVDRALALGAAIEGDRRFIVDILPAGTSRLKYYALKATHRQCGRIALVRCQSDWQSIQTAWQDL